MPEVLTKEFQDKWLSLLLSEVPFRPKVRNQILEAAERGLPCMILVNQALILLNTSEVF